MWEKAGEVRSVHAHVEWPKSCAMCGRRMELFECVCGWRSIMRFDGPGCERGVWQWAPDRQGGAGQWRVVPDGCLATEQGWEEP